MRDGRVRIGGDGGPERGDSIGRSVLCGEGDAEIVGGAG